MLLFCVLSSGLKFQGYCCFVFFKGGKKKKKPILYTRGRMGDKDLFIIFRPKIKLICLLFNLKIVYSYVLVPCPALPCPHTQTQCCVVQSGCGCGNYALLLICTTEVAAEWSMRMITTTTTTTTTLDPNPIPPLTQTQCCRVAPPT